MRAVVVLVVLATNIARADVGVVSTGVPVMQAPVMSYALGWLQDNHFAVAAAPLGASYNAFIDCFVIEDMACARNVFEKQNKATSLVFVRVEQSAPRDYALTAYWFAKGNDPVLGTRQCAQCDDTALIAVLGALLRQLTETPKLEGRIKIKASGDNVMVRVGDVDLQPPVERAFVPGAHVVQFVHHGEAFEKRQIAIEPGVTVEVEPPAAPTSMAPKARRNRLIPAALIGAGVAAMFAGGVLMYYGNKSGPDEPYVYTNATEIGIPVAITGVALVAFSARWGF